MIEEGAFSTVAHSQSFALVSNLFVSQAATILALEAVNELPASAFPSGRKPIVIGGERREREETDTHLTRN